ncbi:SDR family oxidoreductase [Salinisphaera sp. SPP-AMP-43]|uniref:SDR family NAD(P)-dependent oxidoreductase n=1 Tax=Salinisphaera sp. SPP-AMP-43 TaxID=3121288 RepID=UPI003C6E15ED
MSDWLNANFSLAGQTAAVTGASRGIGRALAGALAAAGARVALLARNEAAVAEAAATIETAGGEAMALRCDVSQPDEIEAAFEQIGARWGGLDILVNNAGVEQPAASRSVDEVLWDRLIDVNLKGAFFCAQAAARLMGQSDSDGERNAVIVNLCSLTTAVGVPGSAAYGAAKTGLAGLTRALSTEWAGQGIRVNALGPGYFRTDMTEVFYQDADWQARMQAAIPMGRFGELDDLAGPLVFLCSPAARYMTGQVLYIDGGYLASI